MNHLDKHFILYAKNYYKVLNREEPLYDIAGIIESACGLRQGSSSPYKAYLALCDTFIKVATHGHMQDFFKYLFSPFGDLSVKSADYHYAGQMILNQLGILEINNVDADGNVTKIIDIGKADPEVWPLKD